MATTYALVLRPARAKDGLHPVHLRLTSERTAIYRAVPDVAVSEKHWNEAGTLEKQNWVRGTHPEARRYNEVLRKLMRQVQQLLDDNSTFSAKQLREALDGGGGDDFLAYMQQDIERRRKAGHPRTAEKFASIRSKLQSFRLGIAHPKTQQMRYQSEQEQAQRAAVTLPFSQLSVRLIRDYEVYLAGLGNRETTLNKELSFIKTVLLQAIDEDKFPEAKNPFKKIKLKEGKPRPKAKLTDEEVLRLEALPAEQLTHGELRARDAWLLQYYLLGSRVGDALCLRWRDVRAEEVFFTEHKTGKAKLSPRSTRLNLVLARWAERRGSSPDDFVLPFLDAKARYAQYPAGLTWAELSRLPEYRPLWLALLPKIESATSQINTNLKHVAQLAKIDKNLTSHTARHSFADRGRRRGVSASDMRDMLNHHSISQTEDYYGELESMELTEKSRRIFDE